MHIFLSNQQRLNLIYISRFKEHHTIARCLNCLILKALSCFTNKHIIHCEGKFILKCISTLKLGPFILAKWLEWLANDLCIRLQAEVKIRQQG